MAAYVEFQRILSRSLDFLYSGTTSVSGLQVDCDYLVVTRTIETQLQSWHGDWKRHWGRLLTSHPVAATYASIISDFYFNYSLLVVNSFGLQNAMDKSAVDISHFFARCHTAASACALLARDELGPRDYLRYSPDSHFVQLSYAVLTLLKLIRPEFRPYMENEQRTLGLVTDISNLLGEIAMGSQHTPALYGAFLKALINVKAPVRVALLRHLFSSIIPTTFKLVRSSRVRTLPSWGKLDRARTNVIPVNPCSGLIPFSKRKVSRRERWAPWLIYQSFRLR